MTYRLTKTGRLSKTVIATLLSSLLLTSAIPAGAETQDLLPDIGTSAGATLSIDQEMAMGIFMSAKCVPVPR